MRCIVCVFATHAAGYPVAVSRVAWRRLRPERSKKERVHSQALGADWKICHTRVVVGGKRRSAAMLCEPGYAGSTGTCVGAFLPRALPRRSCPTRA